MKVFINDVWQPLHQEEGVRFQDNQPHGYRNTTTKIARFHDMIHYPES